MGASKIQNVEEVKRSFEEGRTYAWMIEQYREKYDIETTTGMWGNFRRRHGLERRITWDADLIPWKVKVAHRYAYPILMLRKEARRRSGARVSIERGREIDAWLRGMESNDTVLHYDGNTEAGWSYEPRRPGIDIDIIREPHHPSARRRPSD